MQYPIRFYSGDEMNLHVDITFQTLDPVIFHSSEDVVHFYMNSVLVERLVPRYPVAAEWGLVLNVFHRVRGRVLQSSL